MQTTFVAIGVLRVRIRRLYNDFLIYKPKRQNILALICFVADQRCIKRNLDVSSFQWNVDFVSLRSLISTSIT